MSSNCSKVIYSGKTLIDLTQDTVTAETLLVGTTAHDASGKQITGTMSAGVTLNLIQTFNTFLPTSTVESDNSVTSTDDSGNSLVSTFNEDDSVVEVYTAADGTTITRVSVVNGDGTFTDTYTCSDGTTMTKQTITNDDGSYSYTYN